MIFNKIPITVGIVGHRDADFTDAHKKVIVDLLASINEKFPNSPVVLFSQLAEGIDTDVASLFLEHKRKEDQLFLPMSMNDGAFKATFTNQQHAITFDLLKAQANKVIPLNDATLSDDELFRVGAKFVADSSMILIVVWDGKTNNAMGGSAETYTYKVNGYYGKEINNFFNEKSAALSLICNRGNDRTNEIKLPEDGLAELTKADPGILKALQKIEQINVAALKITEEEKNTAASYLMDGYENCSDANKDLISFYAQIDVLAMKKQKKYFLELNNLFILGFLILSIFEFYKHLNTTYVYLSITLSLILLAAGIRMISKSSNNHIRFLEYRVLAEALRIQFFWKLGNIESNVTDYILRIYQNDYDWIKLIINSLSGVAKTAPSANDNNDLLANYWVNNQLSYFSRKIADSVKTIKTLNLVSNAALFISIFILTCMLVFHEYLHGNHLLHLAIVVSGILLGLFALCRTYLEKKGFHQIESQYRMMKRIYEVASEKAKAMQNTPVDPMVLKKLYDQTGKEALIENGNWYAVFKDKEPVMEGIGG
jgi:VIT1/CCC1 family predicted Fe2+/Mn2+ transporter